MKSNLLLLATCFFTLASCTGDNESAEVIDPADVLVKRTVSMNWSGQSVNSVWNYDGNKLVSIISDNGNEQYFTYTGELITKIENHNELDEINTDLFEYDEQGRVIVHKDLSAAFGRKEIYAYGNDGTVAVTKYFGDNTTQEELIENGIMVFEAGEVVHTKSISSGGNTLICDYTYDDKNSPSKNIVGYDRISALFNPNLKGIFRNVTSNLQTDADENSEDNIITKKYTYNSDDYPTKINSIDPLDGDTATVEYYYE